MFERVAVPTTGGIRHTRTSVRDPSLGARVVGRHPLVYTDELPRVADRPPHVRAASGLTRWRNRFLIAQDDASFIAEVIFDTAAGRAREAPQVHSIALPAGPAGRRRFEDALGNRPDKLDLEACLVDATDGGAQLWAFGSGALPVRDVIALIALDQRTPPRLVQAARLYDLVRVAIGSPTINIEGVAITAPEGGFDNTASVQAVRSEPGAATLWLFHRGNTGLADPGPAAVGFPANAVRRWLEDSTSRPPVPIAVVAYDLGTIAGHRVGFTDACAVGGDVMYLAAAEASASAIDDGRVHGAQVGIIAGGGAGTMRWTALDLDGTGALKPEGLWISPTAPGQAWIVADPDDPAQPATLFEVALSGPWF